MFFDAHNHLADARLRPHLEEILDCCVAQKITAMAVNGTHPDDWEQVAQMAERAQAYGILIYPQFGLHPWKSKDRLPADWLGELEDYLKLPLAGIGEVGLDGWKKDLSWERMEAIFLAQLELAAARDLPLSIHCLKAWPLLFKLLQEHPLPERGILLHGFGGDYSIAAQLLKIHPQTYFSFSGYALHERKRAVREALVKLPPEQILLETDAPDMLPPAHAQMQMLYAEKSDQVKLNSPANLAQIYAVAEVLPSAEQLMKNSQRFFFGLRAPLNTSF